MADAYGFNKRDGERIARSVRAFEQHQQPLAGPSIAGQPMGRSFGLFELTATLSSSVGSAAAKRIEISTTGGITSTTDTFTLYDYVYGTLSGSTGARGLYIWAGGERVAITLNCTG